MKKFEKMSKEQKLAIGKSNFKNLLHKKFGKLLVTKMVKDKRGNQGEFYWECVCECGNKKVTSGESLRRGSSKSCGCMRLSIFLT